MVHCILKVNVSNKDTRNVNFVDIPSRHNGCTLQLVKQNENILGTCFRTCKWFLSLPNYIFNRKKSVNIFRRFKSSNRRITFNCHFGQHYVAIINSSYYCFIVDFMSHLCIFYTGAISGKCVSKHIIRPATVMEIFFNVTH